MKRLVVVLFAIVVAIPVLAPAQTIFTDGFECWDISNWSGSSLPDWLEYFDRFRAQARLPWLAANDNWSYGCELHSRYCVKNDYIGHTEDVSNPWYTPDGNAAAQNGNVAVSSSSSAPDLGFLDQWMSGPFHAVGMIDPQLRTTGFGTYHEAIGSWKSAATLDVLRGLGSLPSGVSFPLFFPGDGGRSWLLSYGGSEAPDPLTSCSGYSAPSGPPIILQLGSGGVTPSVTASSFVRDGSTSLEHCIFDETDYSNPNGSYQSLGRSVLGSRDAVVLMPRFALSAGHSYTASITSGGVIYSWTFTTVTATKRAETDDGQPTTDLGAPPHLEPGRTLAPLE